jgi:prepilin-type N-terminal cleavage/methylation domain-containing protein
MMRQQKGLSLVELLVTTSIVGMIMVGMVSIDYALRSNERQQLRSSLVSLRTSAMMFDITSEASQAFGDVATQCIQINQITQNNNNYICIYRDINTTPSDASDDIWTCYTRESADLHKCTFTAAHGADDCNNGARLSDRIIGQVTADVFDPPDSPFVFNNRATLNFYFQITLKSRFDPLTPSLNGAEYQDVLPQEYLTNPKIKLTSQATPVGCVP